MHDAAHSAGGINGDRAVLLLIIAFTLVAIHLINSCITRLVGWFDGLVVGPLIRIELIGLLHLINSYITRLVGWFDGLVVGLLIRIELIGLLHLINSYITRLVGWFGGWSIDLYWIDWFAPPQQITHHQVSWLVYGLVVGLLICIELIGLLHLINSYITRLVGWFDNLVVGLLICIELIGLLHLINSCITRLVGWCDGFVVGLLICNDLHWTNWIAPPFHAFTLVALHIFVWVIV